MEVDESIQYGQLQLIFGPMFSGKSSELIRRIRRYQLSNYSCLLVRYARDSRYSADQVSTHSGKSFPAKLALELKETLDQALTCQVVGIDEGQFFPDVVEYCMELIRLGKIVIVAGLDGTYQRTGFGDMLQLVPLARAVDKLSAICMSCGGKAAFTKRIVDDLQVEVIGGVDKYMAVCRECYNLSSPSKRTPFKDMLIPNYENKENEETSKRNLFVDN